MRKKRVYWFLLALLLSANTNAQWSYRSDLGFPIGQDCDDLSGYPINYNFDFTADILPIFSQYGCADCHDGSDGVFNLSTNNGPPLLPLLGAVSQQTAEPFIEPEFPQFSYLMQKINCNDPFGGVRMPFSGAVVSIEDQGKIYDWIYAGALGEFPPGLWYRDLIFRDNVESLR